MHKLTMSAKVLGDCRRWDMEVHKWRCTLRYAGRRMSVMFYQGMAHTAAPTAAEVIECLASDAAGSEGSFAEWCGEYGYDTDSRKALATYRQIRRQANRLGELLGSDYQSVLYPPIREQG